MSNSQSASKGAPAPGTPLLEVKGLAHPGCCVEIELTAVKAHPSA